MLVLSRRPGEVIHIGDDITITVVEFRDGKVRIGVDAPKKVLVMRGELMADRRSERRLITDSDKGSD